MQISDSRSDDFELPVLEVTHYEFSSIYLSSEEDFSPQFFFEDAPSNSLQDLYQDILSIPCNGSGEGSK